MLSWDGTRIAWRGTFKTIELFSGLRMENESTSSRLGLQSESDPDQSCGSRAFQLFGRENASMRRRFNRGRRALLSGVENNEFNRRITCSTSASVVGSGRKELLDSDKSALRILFGKEVTTFHCMPLRLRSPLPPNAERTAIFCIDSVERPSLGP
jgi:hypothetical protein